MRAFKLLFLSGKDVVDPERLLAVEGGARHHLLSPAGFNEGDFERADPTAYDIVGSQPNVRQQGLMRAVHVALAREVAATP
jgi:hypothetical protein